MAEAPPRVHRAGVLFSCPDCGRLWKDDDVHADHVEGGCVDCGGTLRLVGVGNRMVEHAKWYRCLACHNLVMWRRGEFADANNRTGFDEHTEFDWEPVYPD